MDDGGIRWSVDLWVAVMTLAQAWIAFAQTALLANQQALHRGDAPAVAAPELYRESWKDAAGMMAAMPDDVKAMLYEEGKDPS